MNTNATTSNKLTARFLVLVAMMLLSSVGMFGQNTVTVPASVTLEHIVIAADETVATSNTVTTAHATMNFVSWFMGTKQTSNANSAAEGSSNSRKQLINSGIAPNRLLIKAFLKKASNYATTIA
jgi:hypothetical protein